MPSATDPSRSHAEPKILATASGSHPFAIPADLVAPESVSRCRALVRRTRLSVERGATAVEYALMVGLVSIGIVTAVSALREKTVDSLSHTAASTAGLIFDSAVPAGSTFTVKYVRNDLGVGGFAAVGSPGFVGNPVAPSSGVLTNVANASEYLVTLTAPSTPGIYEVQVRKSAANSALVLENGRLRVE